MNPHDLVKIISKVYLLVEGDVDDLLHTPPHKLRAKLFDLVRKNPDEMRRRYREFYNISEDSEDFAEYTGDDFLRIEEDVSRTD